MCYLKLITNNVPTHLQGDPNVPGGQITFDVDLRRPITDELEPSEQEKNLGVCHAREFTLPSAYEARYTNFPNVCLARYRNDVYCTHSIVGISSLVTGEARRSHGLCARLRSERSGFEPWPGTLCCVLGQNTLLSPCLSPPRCINWYRRT